MITVDEFVDVFNHYEEAKTTAVEASLALARLAKTDDVEYSLKKDILSGLEFQPCFDEYEDDVAAIRESQRGKPRYLPEEDKFLKYVDCSYREPEKPFTDLKAHIIQNKLTTGGDGIDGVDGDMMLMLVYKCGHEKLNNL